MMKKRLVLIVLVLSIIHGSGESASPAQTDYDTGDRLSQTQTDPPAAAPRNFEEVNWDALMSASWDPMEAVKKLDLGNLQDSDPRAQQALDRLMAEWNSAPINPAMNGAPIRIAGFVVPLESVDEKLSEFLLVPYFGACIHVPPPPANQILHVFADDPVADVESMDAVWVDGVVETISSKTSMGNSGYRMNAVKVEAYEQPPMRLPP